MVRPSYRGNINDTYRPTLHKALHSMNTRPSHRYIWTAYRQAELTQWNIHTHIQTPLLHIYCSSASSFFTSTEPHYRRICFIYCSKTIADPGPIMSRSVPRCHHIMTVLRWDPPLVLPVSVGPFILRVTRWNARSFTIWSCIWPIVSIKLKESRTYKSGFQLCVWSYGGNVLRVSCMYYVVWRNG